ncbi:hypothetical protein [Azospirillum brasilense]|uniref:Uncharacterized protein n=1 Tax=Azospirillum brasilense TaxID=192 RepID=A0A6L3AZX1_AZOBR|nr:hypothetical protein [Azospirillum brasilense]KAA0684964.1 hypothetical protein DS837_15940 [Azospirillum brasilense]
MKASDDLQWMLIASLSPSCALPLPLPHDILDGAPDQTCRDDLPLSHRLALGAGVAMAILPVLLATFA